MSKNMGELAWDLYTNLREEVLKAQEIRSKIIEIKITFIGTLYGALLIFGKNFNEYNVFIAIPAFGAIFFDFLIQSYSFSIKRIGTYCRECIDPILKTYYNWNESIPLWEEWQHKVKQGFSTVAHLGLTFLSVSVAVYILLNAYKRSYLFILILLLLLVILDIYIFKNYRSRIDKECKELRNKVNIEDLQKKHLKEVASSMESCPFLDNLPQKADSTPYITMPTSAAVKLNHEAEPKK